MKFVGHSFRRIFRVFTAPPAPATTSATYSSCPVMVRRFALPIPSGRRHFQGSIKTSLRGSHFSLAPLVSSPLSTSGGPAAAASPPRHSCTALDSHSDAAADVLLPLAEPTNDSAGGWIGNAVRLPSLYSTFPRLSERMRAPSAHSPNRDTHTPARRRGSNGQRTTGATSRNGCGSGPPSG